MLLIVINIIAGVSLVLCCKNVPTPLSLHTARRHSYPVKWTQEQNKPVVLVSACLACHTQTHREVGCRLSGSNIRDPSDS